jgi:APA family basic amino acid/polyamine antiporter
VRIGATVASLGVLLSLLVGVSRTGFAMASAGDLPRWLDAVHPTHRVPHRAELAVGALVIAVVLVADVRGAIGFSSFAVLIYYAIANASAWTLSRGERRWPRAIAVLGLAGCAVLAFSLEWSSIAAGTAFSWRERACGHFANDSGPTAKVSSGELPTCRPSPQPRRRRR